MYYEQEGKKAGLTEGMLIGEKRGIDARIKTVSVKCES
jgi:hypothetical protein